MRNPQVCNGKSIRIFNPVRRPKATPNSPWRAVAARISSARCTSATTILAEAVQLGATRLPATFLSPENFDFRQAAALGGSIPTSTESWAARSEGSSAPSGQRKSPGRCRGFESWESQEKSVFRDHRTHRPEVVVELEQHFVGGQV